MKIKFKVQEYQTNAVDAVVDCFAGQPKINGLRCQIDPGKVAQASAFDEGFKNEDIRLTTLNCSPTSRPSKNARTCQFSKTIDDFSEVDKSGNSKTQTKTYKPGAKVNLDIEMRPLERHLLHQNNF